MRGHVASSHLEHAAVTISTHRKLAVIEKDLQMATVLGYYVSSGALPHPLATTSVKPDQGKVIRMHLLALDRNNVSIPCYS